MHKIRIFFCIFAFFLHNNLLHMTVSTVILSANFKKEKNQEKKEKKKNTCTSTCLPWGSLAAILCVKRALEYAKRSLRTVQKRPTYRMLAAPLSRQKSPRKRQKKPTNATKEPYERIPDEPTRIPERYKRALRTHTCWYLTSMAPKLQ